MEVVSILYVFILLSYLVLISLDPLHNQALMVGNHRVAAAINSTASALEHGGKELHDDSTHDQSRNHSTEEGMGVNIVISSESWNTHRH